MGHKSVISFDEFNKAVREMIDDYTDEVNVVISMVMNDITDEAVDELRSIKFGRGKWRKYPNGWVQEMNASKGQVNAVIYNKKHYRLTHLLENGHQIKSGGRKIGESDEIPHIKPIADKLNERAISEMRRYLEQ